MALGISELKPLLGIAEDDESKDGALRFILEDVVETILNYCNLNRLPKGLEKTAYRMAVDMYRHENFGNSSQLAGQGEGNAPVSSISEGGISVSFATDNASSSANASAFANSVMKNYMSALNRYRRMDW